MAKTKSNSKSSSSTKSRLKSNSKTTSKKSKNSAANSKLVKVYSTPGCPWCHRVKEFLKDNKIPFKDVDVSSDQDALNYIVSKSGELGVPQTEINGKIIVGFEESELESEIRKLKK